MSQQKRFVQVGVGGRSQMFRDAITDEYSQESALVGLCDRNEGRLNLARRKLAEKGVEVPVYPADDFDRMVKETRPDGVIVTTMDAFHDTYICRAMELGCDVITEKPMTTDAEKCRRILETQRRTGRACTVTFNYRYAPPRTQVKELLLSGVIGDVLSVDFQWLLNTVHGADYFRRWHRNKENSGGLMVHKSTHHFDLVNWWLGTVPERVSASGHRRFYTPETADLFGLKNRGTRCHGCPESGTCAFFLDLAANENQKALYLDCESHDGYQRDRCVFSPDIDIEDSMNVLVDYANGTKMTYSLNAFTPWEGYLISFNGNRGRLEHKCQETVYVSGDGSVPGALQKEGTYIRIYPHNADGYEVPIREATGGHGGADPVMLSYIFAPNRLPKDALFRAADQRAGAWSILVGVAANQSMADGKPVRIDELVPKIECPDYPSAEK